jgi:LCP family protein required for cell wall assembly
VSVLESPPETEDQDTRIGLQMGKKFALGSLLIVLFTAIAVASGLLLEVHEDVKIFTHESTPIAGIKNVLDEVPLGDPQTILLLGSDHRFADGSDDPPRSDTIIVIHLDPDKHATAIMSIPRDLLVPIPGYGIQKINAAYHYGGPKLTVRTVKTLLGIPINHVINVNFDGFARAVNRLGCVYVDVDRRYFNDHGGPGGYAVINLKAGYQKLCGQDALSFVRFRHTDSDFVRAARQQEFLSEAKAQIGLGKLFGDRRELLKIFGRYTQTDIAQSNYTAILALLKLAYASSKNPLAEIQFPQEILPDGSVEISDAALEQTVTKFIDVQGKSPAGDGGGGGGGGTKPKKIKSNALAPGLIDDQQEGEDTVLATSLRLGPLGLPVYYPKARLGRGGYVSDGSPRSYDIYDRNKNRYRAYRIVLSQGDDGEYYGVEGTTWKAAPILDDPTDSVRMAHRTYKRYFDGQHIRLIAWETPKAVYWVSNTLSLRLTNQQIMGIARSLTRLQ